MDAVNEETDTTNPVYYILLVVVALFVFKVVTRLHGYQKVIHSAREVKGLPGTRLIQGDCWYSSFGEYFEQVSAFVQQTGTRIHKVWIYCFYPLLSLNQSETFHKVLNSSCTKSSSCFDGYLSPKPWIGNGLISLKGGPQWKKRRGLISPAFSLNQIENFMDTFNDCAEDLLIRLSKERRYTSVEMSKPLSVAVLDVLLRCAFSYDGDIQEHGKSNVNVLNKYMEEIGNAMESNDRDQTDGDGNVHGDETDAKIFKSLGKFLRGKKDTKTDLILDDVEDEDFIEKTYTRKSPLITREEMLSNTYKMDYPKRGKAVVFNNKVFSQRLQAQGYSERKGTDIDASRIGRRLELLGFDVERYQNLTVDAMFKVLKALSEEDHSESDCFACVILSHGLKDRVFGFDGEVNLNDVFEMFKGNKCMSLAGKPKLFFIQACRGHMFDRGVHMNVFDAQRTTDEIPMPEQNEIRIPNEADFLIAYSTVSGFYSWRNSSNGSWFIQGLVRMLDEYGTILDIMRIMTRVNRLVAYHFESNTLPDDPRMNRMKQTSCVTSMLTKDLFFIPKGKVQVR